MQMGELENNSRLNELHIEMDTVLNPILENTGVRHVNG